MAIYGDRNWYSDLLGVLSIIGVLAHVVFCCENHASAQITPDGTLGNNSSKITPNVNIKGLTADRIDGGAIRGANLFHSFQEFNVGELQRVYFANPTGIKNILTRVTGSNISNILGTLGVDGGANLFFLNPNGILFGNNARLDVAGSFVASTANSFVFGDRLEFSATNPQTPSPLLTVNPSALLFNQLQAGRIENRSIAPAGIDPSGLNAYGLRVGDGKSLLLVGGNVSIDGGQLNAYGGRVELGGLVAPGNINLLFNGNNLSLKFPENATHADVSLTNQGFVSVVAADGGDIAINAGNIEILGGSTLSAGIGVGLGTPETVAGDITLNATRQIKIAGSESRIRNLVRLGSKGNGGNIFINSGDLSLQDGAEIIASTYGQGNAGNVTVGAKNAVSLADAYIFSVVEAEGVGKGGNIDINAATLSLIDGAQLVASTFGQGNGGNVTVDAKDTVSLIGQQTAFFSTVQAGGVGKGGNIDINAATLSLIDGAQLVASTSGQGNGGNVTVDAKNAVSLAGQPTAILSTVEAGGVGQGGNIDINAATLSLADGAQLQTSTRGTYDNQPAAKGDAGNINITVTGQVEITGQKNNNGIFSTIDSSVDTGTVGNGGNITIDSGDFSLQDGAQLSASTYGQGNAGNVTVGAKNAVSLAGEETTIYSTVEAGGVGRGGDIDINAATLSLIDGAQLQTITRRADDTQPAGKGDAGNVKVKVTGVVDIAGVKNGLSSAILSYVDTGTVGNGGNITIDSGDFLLQDGAQLSASTYGQGNAGNMTVGAKNAVSLAGEETTIYSRVEAGGVGRGGDIDINAATLSLIDGAQLQTITRRADDTQPAGKGDAGNVKVKVTGVVDIAGVKNGLSSAILSYVDTGTVGNGGNITIDSGDFSLQDGAQLSALTSGQGNAGNVTVTAKDAVSLADNAVIFTKVETGGVGKGGNIDINAATLSLIDGAQLITLTSPADDTQPAGKGDAGNVKVKVTGVVDIAGVKNGLSSAISSRVDIGTEGNGGNISIDAGSLKLRDGALLDARTYNDSKGGDITVNANVFEATGGGQLITTTSSNGRAGKITVNATDRVIISGSDLNYNDRITKFPSRVANIGANSGLFVSSTASGITGDIEINSNLITLDNQGKLNAESASGNGGNINVNSDLLLLRRNSQISTSAGTEKLGGDGGNININSRFIVAVPKENSDISANAFTGSGGRVDITSDGLFGIVRQKSPSEKSDITASSELGVSGQVIINTPDLDPSRGLIQLPSNLVDVSQQITQGCTPRRGQNANRFIATGRGGLPLNPNEPLRGQAVITGWVDLPSQATPRVTDKLSTATVTKSTDQIVEAQGWIVDANGNVILVAQSGQSSSIPSAMSCNQ
ncbi:two-partner secretion domain-containing protein [Nostoc sp.]|uniref:two-partner secretion domain-containing protein n=1 Tax=Nostoc sp. TaxID=1180 RepID=UPI002FF52652